MQFLKNKKTYLCAIGIGVVAALQFLGILDAETVKLLDGLLGAGGLAALRSAVQ